MQSVIPDTRPWQRGGTSGRRWIVLLAAIVACEGDPAKPDPEPEPEPTLDVDGFRILSVGVPIFEWEEGDPLEADTLYLTWGEGTGVRFLWLDGAGDSVDVGEHELIVTTPDERFATWQGSVGSSLGVFWPGSFPNVETSFRVRLVTPSDLLVATPDLVLVVRDD